jgi:hypothetical protein
VHKENPIDVVNVRAVHIPADDQVIPPGYYYKNCDLLTDLKLMTIDALFALKLKTSIQHAQKLICHSPMMELTGEISPAMCKKPS